MLFLIGGTLVKLLEDIAMEIDPEYLKFAITIATIIVLFLQLRKVIPKVQHRGMVSERKYLA